MAKATNIWETSLARERKRYIHSKKGNKNFQFQQFPTIIWGIYFGISEAARGGSTNSHWGLWASEDEIPYCRIVLSHLTLFTYSSKSKIAASSVSDRMEFRATPSPALYFLREQLKLRSSSATSPTASAEFCPESVFSRLVFLALLSPHPRHMLFSRSSFSSSETVVPRDRFCISVLVLFSSSERAELEVTGEEKDNLADDPADLWTASVSWPALWVSSIQIQPANNISTIIIDTREKEILEISMVPIKRRIACNQRCVV